MLVTTKTHKGTGKPLSGLGWSVKQGDLWKSRTGLCQNILTRSPSHLISYNLTAFIFGPYCPAGRLIFWAVDLLILS